MMAGVEEPEELRCVDSAIASVIDDIDSAFILKEQQRTAIKAFVVTGTHHVMATTPECFHVPTVMSGVIHIMPAQPETIHIMPARSESLHVIAALKCLHLHGSLNCQRCPGGVLACQACPCSMAQLRS
ncbi:hypothetical protein DPX16_9038 [Anabarilius grahami]|uniref:Uncharacterized protein n=1 Tax=Anabarilius grahami TaxID=495550 RepID=A0A3N0YJH0_ANAGA|nr:hypothetical protein DPX16_9038 [Anabarilius grahami]